MIAGLAFPYSSVLAARSSRKTNHSKSGLLNALAFGLSGPGANLITGPESPRTTERSHICPSCTSHRRLYWLRDMDT
jgi:hypothetical protein